MLTEDDLKCLLFSKLYGYLPSGSTIDKGVTASAIHSEVNFYDEDGQLTLRPDLCIVEPMHMSIYHSVEFKIKRTGENQEFKKLPSKNYEIGGNIIVIELKFCRDRNGVGASDVLSYKDDISKIERLQEIVSRRSLDNDKLFGVFAVFNKTNNGYELIKPIIEDETYQGKIWCFYGSGLFDFNNEHRFPGNDGYLTERFAKC